MSIQTIPAPTPTLPPAMPPEPVYRLSVEQYHEMIRAGILTEGDPVELLEGWLVPKMTKNPPHTFATEQLRDLLPPLVPVGWFVNSQAPVTSDTSEPEPDILIVRGTRRDYTSRNPGPADSVLLIEVADTSLWRDRGLEETAVRRGQCPCELDRQVEVYTLSSGAGAQAEYGQQQNYDQADRVPVAIEGREVGRVAIQDTLP